MPRRITETIKRHRIKPKKLPISPKEKISDYLIWFKLIHRFQNPDGEKKPKNGERDEREDRENCERDTQ